MPDVAGIHTEACLSIRQSKERLHHLLTCTRTPLVIVSESVGGGGVSGGPCFLSGLSLKSSSLHLTASYIVIRCHQKYCGDACRRTAVRRILFAEDYSYQMGPLTSKFSLSIAACSCASSCRTGSASSSCCISSRSSAALLYCSSRTASWMPGESSRYSVFTTPILRLNKRGIVMWKWDVLGMKASQRSILVNIFSQANSSQGIAGQKGAFI